MGVDQSVLILKSGNDFDSKEVFDEFDKFSKIGHKNSEKSYSDFKDTNLHIITNAKKEYPGKVKKIRPYYRGGWHHTRRPCFLVAEWICSD